MAKANRTTVATLPNFKHTPSPPAAKTAVKSVEEIAADILAIIRQSEPEQQNEIVKIILVEIGMDRSKTLQLFREGQDRASKNLDEFVTQATYFEKLLCTAREEYDRQQQTAGRTK
jgi:hypothetical protein